MRLRGIPRVSVRDVEAGSLQVRPPLLVVRALESEEEELGAAAFCRVEAVDEILHALDIRAIDASLGIVHAAGVEEEEAPRVFAGLSRLSMRGLI